MRCIWRSNSGLRADCDGGVCRGGGSETGRSYSGCRRDCCLDDDVGTWGLSASIFITCHTTYHVHPGVASVTAWSPFPVDLDLEVGRHSC